MSERVEKAKSLFKAGASCSQAVVAAFADLFGMDEETAMCVSAGLGGGVGRLREVCGVVTGMAVLAGLKAGNTSPADAESKKKTYDLVQQMAAAFKEKNRYIVCRELRGLDKKDPLDPTPAPRTEEYYHTRPCADLVADAAEIVEQILLK